MTERNMNDDYRSGKRTGSTRFMRWVILIVLIAAGIIAGIAWGGSIAELFHDHEQQGKSDELYWCGMHPQVIQDKPGICPICHMKLEPIDAKKLASLDKGVLIDPVVVQNMGVRVAAVTEGPLKAEVRAVGYLKEPDPARRDVNLRVSGWIERLYADTEGMAVRKGQPLFDLYSPDVNVAVQELITARRSVESAGDDLRRQTAQTLYETAQRKLELWGLTGAQVAELAKLERAPRTVALLSPIDGHVAEKMVFEGAAVEAGMTALRLGDTSTLWLDAQVYEQQLSLVEVGQTATAAVAGRPGKPYAGTVTFIHPHIDPMTRTALVRIELPNGDHFLRQGMYATVEIRPTVEAKSVLAPREAIIDTGTRKVAYVSLDDGYFEPRELKLGQAGADGVVQVLEGLTPGEQVVVSGQFLLDSESRMKEAIQKQLKQMLLAKGEAGTVAATPTTAPAGPAAPVVLRGDLSPLDALFAEYLAAVDYFGAVEQKPEPYDVSRLRAAAAGYAPAESIEQLAGTMVGQSAKEQRQTFKGISEAMIAIAKATPPTGAVAERLYIQHCPMAPGSWLQRTERLANPYYAKAMKTCGETTGVIAAREEGRP